MLFYKREQLPLVFGVGLDSEAISWAMYLILGISIVAKLMLAAYYAHVGKKINSAVVSASAADSLMDAASTLAVLVSGIVIGITGLWFIDSIVGIAVSLMIFVAGLRILNDTKNSLLGEAPMDEVIGSIEDIVKENEILLASRDIYLPQDEALDNGDYDFDEQSTQKEITATSSIFDVAMYNFEKHFENATVKSFDISPLGDLHIDFTNGVYFETFTPSVRKCEEWRFLPPSEEDHLVIFDV